MNASGTKLPPIELARIRISDHHRFSQQFFKLRSAAPGRQCEAPSDQHAPPLQCGSPGSDKVRACTTICFSSRKNSSSSLSGFPRKLRENRSGGHLSKLGMIRAEVKDGSESADIHG